LHQPDLLTYFQTRLQAMSEFNLPIIHQIQDALVEVKPLIDVANARIPAESVKKGQRDHYAARQRHHQERLRNFG